MPHVADVWTTDTHKEISGLINAAADQYGFDAVGYLGMMIAESGLKEGATRNGVWPDVSHGLTQQVTIYLDPNRVPGITGTVNGENPDTPENREAGYRFLGTAENAIPYSAVMWSYYYNQNGGNNEQTCWSWNWPSWRQYPNALTEGVKASYARALAQAAAYAVADGPREAPTLAQFQTAVTTEGGLNLRRTPGVNGEAAEQLPAGTKVLVLETPPVSADGFDWQHVAVAVAGDLVTGYVAGQYLRAG